MSPPARGCRSIPQPFRGLSRRAEPGWGARGGSRAGAPGAAVGSACPQLGCGMDFQTQRPHWERPTGYIQHPSLPPACPAHFPPFQPLFCAVPALQEGRGAWTKKDFVCSPPLLGVKVLGTLCWGPENGRRCPPWCWAPCSELSRLHTGVPLGGCVTAAAAN